MRIISREARIFLRKFMNHPKQIGSVVPSSRFLAESMVNAIPWHNVKAAAELGAGTGAITQYIAQRASKDAEVYLFEKDTKMRRQLKLEYPGFTCAANAANMLRILEGNGERHLDCILSGLPFYNFPQEVRDQLMEQIVGALKPGGLFVAFQYSLQMKKQMAKLFDIEKIKFVPLNFPPAFVYVCRKRLTIKGECDHADEQEYYSGRG
ncbi:class I SAM-dependent methyltransferase [Cohnella silvisoli]|uniref:Methyltransferase domain-containing protein n=1 Tax=Cohnella silvisoli TaxID=2873699 RepID=A0ABV1KY43_9BACL|nr:methyltransferase domain-containing protein [Cohnella silvisoli]MCD9023976.1 methyltransferase domain-containing protein [Cohnella silvisoli]